MKNQKSRSDGLISYLKNLYLSKSKKERALLLFPAIAGLFLLIAFIGIGIGKGFDKGTSAILVVFLMFLIVFGGALLIGYAANKPKKIGGKSPVWRICLALCGACMLLVILVNVIAPPEGKEASMTTLLTLLIMAILFFLPLGLYIAGKGRDK